MVRACKRGGRRRNKHISTMRGGRPSEARPLRFPLRGVLFGLGLRSHLMRLPSSAKCSEGYTWCRRPWPRNYASRSKSSSTHVAPSAPLARGRQLQSQAHSKSPRPGQLNMTAAAATASRRRRQRGGAPNASRPRLRERQPKASPGPNWHLTIRCCVAIHLTRIRCYVLPLGFGPRLRSAEVRCCVLPARLGCENALATVYLFLSVAVGCHPASARCCMLGMRYTWCDPWGSWVMLGMYIRIARIDARMLPLDPLGNARV